MALNLLFYRSNEEYSGGFLAVDMAGKEPMHNNGNEFGRCWEDEV